MHLRRLFTFCAAALLCAPGLSQNAPTSQESELNAIVTEAMAAYQDKAYARSAEFYGKAIERGASNPTIAYNAACCFALLDKNDEAFRYLTLAIEKGWRELDHMRSDSDLDGLHADPRWAAALSQCEDQREKFLKTIKEPALREELLKRMREDQQVRMANPPDIKRWTQVDAENTARMKEIVDKYGWPGKSLVGSDGALAAFLMVQHADREPAFQKRCLDLLKKAYEAKDVTGSDVAYLTDRVLCAEGKKQLYGTQFQTVKGELMPKPIEDEANVDARRKEMGLGTMAEYAKVMKAQAR